MRFGVKYCGGCNPRYQRGEFLKMISRHFQNRVDFELAKEDTLYDGLLVLGGCSNCCPDYRHFQTKTPPILVWDQDHFNQVTSQIESRLAKAREK